jgi:hypothetical protein
VITYEPWPHFTLQVVCQSDAASRRWQGHDPPLSDSNTALSSQLFKRNLIKRNLIKRNLINRQLINRKLIIHKLIIRKLIIHKPALKDADSKPTTSPEKHQASPPDSIK